MTRRSRRGACAPAAVAAVDRVLRHGRQASTSGDAKSPAAALEGRQRVVERAEDAHAIRGDARHRQQALLQLRTETEVEELVYGTMRAQFPVELADEEAS